MRLSVGERQRWLRYDQSRQDGTVLTFAYQVKKVDTDDNGVSIGANQLLLKGGSIADADGNAANLNHSALPAQSGHKVNGSQEAAPAEGQQQQASNSAPQFASEDATLNVNEDTAIGANVGAAVTATDAESDTLTYALTGSDAFAINGSSGQITVRSALDYETQSSYSLTVSVSDGKSASGETDTAVDDTIAVTVNVTNVDEAGVVSLESEDDPPQVGSGLLAILLDLDGVVGNAAWTWARSADGETWDAIDGATGASYTTTDDDAGRYLQATAAYTDGHGAGKTAGAQTSKAVASPPVDIPPAPQDPETLPQTRAGTITSGTANSNVATLSGGPFSSATTFQVCLADWYGSCEPSATSGVAAGTKITSVGITVATDGTISYDGTRIDSNGVHVSAWTNGSKGNVANIQVLSPLGRVRAKDVVGGDGQVTLTWYKSADTTITKWQYRYIPFSDHLVSLTSVDWKDIPNSDHTTTSYIVTGLENYKAYLFALRAVSNAGFSSQSTFLASGKSKAVPRPAVNLGERPVAKNWKYTPDGLDVGKRFRLLFVTKDTTAATETGIDYYNNFVLKAVVENEDLVYNNNSRRGGGLARHFRALVSVGAEESSPGAGDGIPWVHARDNTLSTAPSVPIYWLGGERIADGYDKFYNRNCCDPWESYEGKTEFDKPYTRGVWTGSDSTGYAGVSGFTAGDPDGGTKWGTLTDDFGDYYPVSYSSAASSIKAPLYAMSPVLVIVPMAKAENLEASPGDGTVALSWDFKAEEVPPGARWQYRMRAPDHQSYFGHWSDVGPDGRLGRYTVLRGTNNGTAYDFQVRLLDKDGNAGTLSNVVSATPKAWTAPQPQTIAANSPLIPKVHGRAQVGPGESFRLLFVTSDKTHALSGYISHYNYFTQRAAARNTDMVNSAGSNFSGEFRALISTARMDARDNTATTGKGVPIYYLTDSTTTGEKVADDYADFYDGSWDRSYYARDEQGRQMTWGLVWTGSEADGTRHGGENYAGHPGGAVVYASVPGEWGTLTEGHTNGYKHNHLYALSPVLTVASD